MCVRVYQYVYVNWNWHSTFNMLLVVLACYANCSLSMRTAVSVRQLRAAVGCRQAVYRRVVDAVNVVAQRMNGSQVRAWVVTGFVTPHTEVVVTDAWDEAEALP